MTIVITGATGQLGRLVVEELLERNVPAGQIVAAGRNVARLADLADRGVQVRSIDFEDPASLQHAFAGAEKVLLVSGTATTPPSWPTVTSVSHGVSCWSPAVTLAP